MHWWLIFLCCDNSTVVILFKSHFTMDIFLYIYCIFSKHLFLKTPLDGCFWRELSQPSVRKFIKKKTPTMMFFCEFCEAFKDTLLKNTSGRLLYKFYTKTHHEKNILCSFENILSKSYTKEENINKALRSTKFRILLDCRSFSVLLSHYEKSTYTNNFDETY